MREGATPISVHGSRFEIRVRYAGGLVAHEPLFVTEDMIDRAARALAVGAGDGEAYDRGASWAREWRNEAEVALRAAVLMDSAASPRQRLSTEGEDR